MSIFGKILGGIFGKKKEEAHEAKVAETSPAEAALEPVIIEEEVVEPVDVDALLTEKAEAASEKLDWKVSIVDLLKLLSIDSSYGARKELAAELGIDGYEGSAAQNIEMHKIVLTKLAENGGKLPEDLLA